MAAIQLPDAKPAFEWVNGRALQKVSPKRQHAVAQSQFIIALGQWARRTKSGVAGPEWRFHVKPAGGIRRPLVPDVAFLSYARLPYERMLATEEPSIAPDVVVEVRSPSDRDADVEEKVGVYLAAGTSVVFLVDPVTQTVTVCESRGRRSLNKNDVIRHKSLPGFRLAVRRLFELPKPKAK